jgi:hypothetical protein
MPRISNSGGSWRHPLGMTARHRAIGWAAVAVLHFTITFALVIYVFGAGMARFDTGAPASRTERIASLFVTVLAFPVLNGLWDVLPVGVRSRGFPWDHLVFLVNSAVWATVLMALWMWRRTRTGS